MAEALNSTSGIYLPGGIKQFEHLRELPSLKGDHALIIGAGCEAIANKLTEYYRDIHIITEDYGSLIQSRIKVVDDVRVKMMEYSHTDFASEYFDLIYAQGSLAVPARKNIIKEIKRILSPHGLLCTGEIVAVKEPVAAFIRDIWRRNGLLPLSAIQIVNFYINNGFELISEKDLTNTLKDYYLGLINMISKASREEIEDNKKDYSGIKHEANAYLKMGGEKYIAFKSLLLRKLN